MRFAFLNVLALAISAAASPVQKRDAAWDAIFDSGMDLQQRYDLVNPLPDSTIWEALGKQPILNGREEFHETLRSKVVILTKFSAMHAIEMQKILEWGVPFGVVPDQGASYYFPPDDQYPAGHVELSKDMTIGDTHIVGIETVAHELGHATFQMAGYRDIIHQGIVDAGLDDHDKYGNVEGVINEPFAGIFGNRAWMYRMTGLNYDNADKSKNEIQSLQLIPDVVHLMRPPADGEEPGFYYKYYNLTPAAWEEKDKMVQILRTIIQKLKDEFGLANDPAIDRLDSYGFSPSDFPPA